MPPGRGTASHRVVAEARNALLSKEAVIEADMEKLATSIAEDQVRWLVDVPRAGADQNWVAEGAREY